MKDKRVAILTRHLSMKTLEDNEIYKSELVEKLFYPTQCLMSDSEKQEAKSLYRVSSR